MRPRSEPGGVEMGVVAQAGEGVEERALVLVGEGRAVGGDEREPLGLGELDEAAVGPVLAAGVVALQLDVEVASTEDVFELCQ